MHIPDGYLSPSTCASLYGAALPFWLVALNRVKKTLHTRMIPLLSVFSAFSFVIMMFNLPLPGGTTGHAVGMGVAGIVLGPWAAILAISTALLIQAFFFGDGGITAIGANCFNMAIVGSLVAYAVYRVVSRRAPIQSTRRIVAAGIAGYAGINVAALLAAVEFGIQPVFFHDASGAPLYAPYSLSVSIPAMMLGHLTFAGLAELVITSGIVAWLQKVDPALLCLTAPGVPNVDSAATPWSTARKLWLALAVLLVLTPLGILAVGSAWGEWTASDFSDPQARAQIAAASRNQAAPAQAPRGLERLSSLWNAPLSRYAPSFIGNTSFGYIVSALLGVALIVFLIALFARLVGPPSHRRQNFIEKTLRHLIEVMQGALFAEEMAQAGGFLQKLDARVKLVGIGALILAAISVRRLSVLCALLLTAVLLALASRIPVRVLATRIWLAVLLFTGVIALPAIFLTPGTTLYRLPLLDWAISYQGLRGAAFLVLRAETAATLSVLLILCTLWTHLLRALRFFRLPVILVVIVGMTYRYIFLLLQTALDMFEAREARLVGTLQPSDRRRLAAASAGVLLGRSLQLSGDVHMAMQARGFRGEVHLLDEPQMRAQDWLPLTAFAAIACAAIWWGR
ncbi:MAG TPA: cobalt transporter CbiM [Bryobacteraceae bacterium]|nr:cobalt transporter CbiM [Bryobacteraceae bacterium]